MSALESLLRKPCFALYRLPRTNVVRALWADAAETLDAGLAGAAGREGFVVAPYDPSRDATLFIPAAHTLRTYTASLPDAPAPMSGYEESDRQRYARDFARVMQALDAGQCMKLVLARRVRLRLAAFSFDALATFAAACRAYPRNYVAMWRTPQSGLWLTATPELLLSRDGDGQCRTIALAGTMPADNDAAKTLAGWDEKNLEEQRLVQQHIHRVLHDSGVAYRVSRTRPARSGSLLHLRTDFTFSAPSALQSLLDHLHPTPAVCGMPVRRAKSILAAAEGIRRGYYAGYSGSMAADGAFSFYVTLRCLRADEQGCDLFAGSGILSQSNEETEWLETERKLDALRLVLPLKG
ncbi:MAG: chorismate-binding protein [Bacteroidaceae bacterium]|nr:chorismate-binding protein [Bacteroidaceae bacterium]